MDDSVPTEDKTGNREMERLARARQETCRGGPKDYVVGVLGVLRGGGKRYGLGLVISEMEGNDRLDLALQEMSQANMDLSIFQESKLTGGVYTRGSDG